MPALACPPGRRCSTLYFRMKLLALETATEACSVALAVGDDLRLRFEVAPRKHTELVLPMVDALLAEAGLQARELDAVAFGQGPGAFTGVRIAIAVAQGLAFAHDLPVIAVSTLAALAQAAAAVSEYAAPALDARMREVYWGLYKKDEQGLMQGLIKDSVGPPGSVAVVTAGPWYGLGSGWRTYPHELGRRFGDRLTRIDARALPSARGVLELARPAWLAGKTLPVEQARPVYLRNRVVRNPRITRTGAD